MRHYDRFVALVDETIDKQDFDEQDFSRKDFTARSVSQEEIMCDIPVITP